ncbi:MAG TPA: hypothetical protein VF812_00975 [Ktedonobacterales bacterium]
MLARAMDGRRRLARWRRRLAPLALVGVLGCLSLAGCAGSAGNGGTASGAATATATSAPTATATPKPTPTATPQPTTCAQVPGFSGAVALTLANLELPSGAIARAPSVSFGGAGQYTVKTYSVCVPNNTTQLIVSTGKGPEPLAQLVLFYGWAPWTHFPSGGAAQVGCTGTCFAFNADDPTKALFSGAPRFLAVQHVTQLPHGLVTFTLALAQAPDPTCASMFATSDMAIYGHQPEYTLYYDLTAGIQWPPMTRLVGNSTPSTIGQDLCSAGNPSTIKAFMDTQFSSHGYTSVACSVSGGDCWKNSATTVTMTFASASDWSLSTPRTP